MSDESTSPAARESKPPTMDPSPVVRGLKELRELATDLGGMVLAAYFVTRGALSAQIALVFVLTLVLPSSVLTRYAKIILARGGSTGAAVALVGATAAYAQIKTAAVVGAAALSLASCVGGL